MMAVSGNSLAASLLRTASLGEIIINIIIIIVKIIIIIIIIDINIIMIHCYHHHHWHQHCCAFLLNSCHSCSTHSRPGYLILHSELSYHLKAEEGPSPPPAQPW